MTASKQACEQTYMAYYTALATALCTCGHQQHYSPCLTLVQGQSIAGTTSGVELNSQAVHCVQLTASLRTHTIC